MTAISSATRSELSFERLKSFPALFHTYCMNPDALASHFAGSWRDLRSLQQAAERAVAHERNRALVADVLSEQNAAWGATDGTQARIDQLRDPDSVAVVTGQQVGLFGGPLYTPLKMITTLQVADRLAEQTGRPVIPVFWLEGEDHDFEEVSSTWLFHRNEVVELHYEKGAENAGYDGPVGRLVLTEAITELIAELEEVLPPSDFRPQVLRALRETYQPGTTLLDAFAGFMHRLFSDAALVCIDPSDERLKAEAGPLFVQEIEEHEITSRYLQQSSGALQEEFHAQVQTHPTNVFLLEDGKRLPIDAVDGEFELRGTGRRLSPVELRQLAITRPERFSPNVVLRPLVQDTLLPTAVYVGGPGEISYFAQFKPLYEWAGLPMPVIYPRASATIIELKVQKVLDKYDLELPDLEGNLEPLFQQVVQREMDVDLDAIFADAGRSVHRAINDLKPQVEQVDRTLGPSTEATRAAISKEMAELKSRVVKAGKRNQDEVLAQLEKAQVNLFPRGKPQERVINPIYFLNKYGMDLLGDLRQELSLDTHTHQLIAI